MPTTYRLLGYFGQSPSRWASETHQFVVVPLGQSYRWFALEQHRGFQLPENQPSTQTVVFVSTMFWGQCP